MSTTGKLQGIYLVIDPSTDRQMLLQKLGEAISSGINLLQIWNHWPENFELIDKVNLIDQILELAAPLDVPVLINENWELLMHAHLNGIHFDHFPEDLETIKKKVGRTFLTGITIGNNIKVIDDIGETHLDYVSFCSMFPSSSVDTCEIVRPESVLAVRQKTQKPIFLSGGIRPENLKSLKPLDFQGVAIISGIMDAPSISERILTYQNVLKESIT